MKLNLLAATAVALCLAVFISLAVTRDKPDEYMRILKRAGAYNRNDQRTIPHFTYQAADDPNLVALRQSYHLDSVAGRGDQISQVLNLMYWLHDRVPHDGNRSNPPVKNASSLLAVCQKENRSLNCRGLATVLNECYLAIGFKSRFVTCQPKDSLGTDNDCHVINMVYINSLKKWIWIDPTVAGYVKDENGNFLSIEEVRARMINNQPIQLNNDANWNHRQKKNNKNWMYGYMAKNLYRFECPARSEYNTETTAPGKMVEYVELLPLDYFKQNANNKTITTNASKTFTMVDYATNNPAAFWEAPTN